MAALNYNGVGGGSVLYNAQWPRLMPSDFRVRSEDGVAADWPFGYADLQPFYDETDRQFGVSGLGGNPAYPMGGDPPLPPLPIGPPGMAVARSHSRLGWHWWPDSNAILSAARDGRRACVRRGTCARGCDEGAKASADLTHWPRFQRLGGTLVTRAVVRRILVDRFDRASGVEWVDADGKVHVQRADVVLCAANGIGTPRLLLASATDRHPHGLANDSGLVGRGLMLHPMALVQGVLPDITPWHGHNGGLINSLQFYASDPSRGFIRGARWALTAGGHPLATALDPRVGWGESHHRRVRERVGRRVTWVLLAEDLPDHANAVTLSGDVDAAGLAGAALTYHISDNTDRLLTWHSNKAIESLAEAGVRDVTVTRARANGHFMGTARMGVDPSTSVCDPWGFTHQIRNLGVIDGSVFPTAGGMNPTSTICAVALRTARSLLHQRGSAPVASRSRGETAGAARSARFVSLSVRVKPGSRAEPADSLSTSERRRLCLIADALIPAGHGMPSASEAGGGEELLDALLRVRPDLGPPLHSALVSLGAEDALAGRLPSRDPASFATLTLVVAGAYYLSPKVGGLLRWRAEEGRPLEAGAFPPYIAEGLLDHLIDTADN